MPAPRFSVIIVSWNVSTKLSACLDSLACAGAATWAEVLVVDNASKDGSADMVRTRYPWVKLTALTYNAGFAAACNLAAKAATAPHLVLLNPDTEVGDKFFDTLATAWQAHPQAAVIGGKLLNEDGTIQPSVRGFPTLWSSLLDSVKLLGRFPQLAPRYLKTTFDYSKVQAVEQVMGACFSVSRQTWDAFHGLDQGYWIWFEEADFCKRAHDRGLEVWYDPEILVRHTLGASFRQLGYLEKHQRFTKSLLRYLRLHASPLTFCLVWLTSRPWFVVAWLLDVARPRATLVTPTALAVCLACLEGLSWWGWHSPLVGSVTALAVTVLWFSIAARNLSLGVALLVLELVVGSLGGLVYLELGGVHLSLRQLLFIAGLTLMVWRLVTRQDFALTRYPRLLTWYTAALAALGWGSVVALSLGRSPADFFLDLQRYLYILLFPLCFEALHENEGLKLMQRVLTTGLVWLGIKTTSTLYLFSHLNADQLISYYQWWRQTGFGEITYVSGNFFRVFSQSQVFAALGSAAGFAWLWRDTQARVSWQKHIAAYLFLWFSLSLLFMSFSRSFWLGTAVAWVVVLLPSLFRRGAKVTSYLKYLAVSAILTASAVGFTLVVTQVPWPLPPLSSANASLLADRLSKGEAASASRLALLPPLGQAVLSRPIAGSGFGATVTFLSRDPRLIRSTAGGSGLTTTYSFEWGYLDLWLKLGLLGLSLYLGFWLYGLWPAAAGWWQREPFGVSITAAATALLVLNLTTPYLNHPLGIGALMALVAAAWQRPPAEATV